MSACILYNRNRNFILGRIGYKCVLGLRRIYEQEESIL